jgi:hypothetical protein
MIPLKSTATTQGEHVFFDIDVKGGERGIVGMFTGRVCLSLMARTTSDDGMFTGKKINNEESNNDGKQGKHKFRRRSEQYENQISGGIA